jgi:hypothetical protein
VVGRLSPVQVRIDVFRRAERETEQKRREDNVMTRDTKEKQEQLKNNFIQGTFLSKQKFTASVAVVHLLQ